MEQITIRYPPDFDGETHISVKETATYFEYSFQQSKTNSGIELTKWTALVQVAEAIVAQNNRLRK
jgi:hypothetical protein